MRNVKQLFTDSLSPIVKTSRILIADNESATRNLLYRFFTSKNYQVQTACDASTAMSMFKQFQPNLVILDINLPDAISYSLCREMQNLTNVFVLLLTSRSDLQEKIRGFEMGADDCLTKPFNLQELKCRVDALLRRNSALSIPYTKRLVFNELAIDPMRQEVTLNDETIILTALEFKILHFLASYSNRVWRRVDIIQHVWNSDYIDERVIDTHIGRIRQKIQTDINQPSLIQTVRGVGYVFAATSNTTLATRETRCELPV